MAGQRDAQLTADRPDPPGTEPPGSGSGGRTCPSCLADNPPTYVFCQSCGRLLPRSAPASGPDRTVPLPTSESLQPILVPISIDLVRAGRATLFDSDSIRLALAAVETASRQLQELIGGRMSSPGEEYAWERNTELAETSSLIEGAGALLALAAAPDTRDNLRWLFVRRAFWVLRTAADRTRTLLAKGER